MSQKIEIILPAKFEFSPLMRDLSEKIFLEIGFTVEWSERLKLVLNELFNNAVEYGSDELSQVYVTFFFDEEEFSFHVEDEGKGEKKVYPLELSAIIRKNMEELDQDYAEKHDGRGLAMISREWADQLKIEASPKGGLLLGFKKSIVRDSSNDQSTHS